MAPDRRVPFEGASRLGSCPPSCRGSALRPRLRSSCEASPCSIHHCPRRRHCDEGSCVGGRHQGPRSDSGDQSGPAHLVGRGFFRRSTCCRAQKKRPCEAVQRLYPRGLQRKCEHRGHGQGKYQLQEERLTRTVAGCMAFGALTPSALINQSNVGCSLGSVSGGFGTLGAQLFGRRAVNWLAKGAGNGQLPAAQGRGGLTPSSPPREGGCQVGHIAAIPAGAAETLLSIEGPYQGDGAALPIRWNGRLSPQSVGRLWEVTGVSTWGERCRARSRGRNEAGGQSVRGETSAELRGEPSA